MRSSPLLEFSRNKSYFVMVFQSEQGTKEFISPPPPPPLPSPSPSPGPRFTGNGGGRVARAAQKRRERDGLTERQIHMSGKNAYFTTHLPSVFPFEDRHKWN